MKTYLLRAIMALLLAAVLSSHGVNAAPFTVRQVNSGDTGIGADSQVGAADFDGDGHTEWYAGGNHIHRFPRTGTIQLPNLTLPGSPASVTPKPRHGVVCDVDRDGDMDIVRINDWNGDNTVRTLQVFLNNGTGSFSAGYRFDWAIPLAYTTYGISYDMVAADFNADGAPDLALVTRYYGYDTGSIMVRMNDGGGNFTSSSTIESGGFSYEARLAAADIDHDGDADLVATAYVVSGQTDHRIRIYRSHRNGTFTASTRTTPERAEELSIKDVNGDGWPDMVAGHWSKDSSALHLNNKAGGFDDAITLGTRFIECGDANEDSAPDLLVRDYSNSSYHIRFHRGDRSGSFGPAETLFTIQAVYSRIRRTTLIDADGDGDQDIILLLTWNSQDDYYFVENLAPRRGNDAVTASYTTIALSGAMDLEVADLGGDGYDDLLVVTPSTSRIHSLVGLPGGGFAAPVFKNTAGSAASTVVAGDFDADGDTDIAYTVPGTGKIRMARQTGSAFFLWSDSEIGSLAGASKMVKGNFSTPGGTPDLLVSSSTSGNVRWFYHQGDPAFWSDQGVVTTSLPAAAICAADTTSKNGDEVFCLGADSNTLEFKGLQLGPPWQYVSNFLQVQQMPHVPQVLAFAEMLGNGKKQAVFVDGAGRLVCWTPDSSLSPAVTVIDAAQPEGFNAIATVDWNRDGRPDLVCGGNNRLTFYLSTGAGWKKTVQSITAPIADIVAIDFDHDGLDDIVASQPLGNGLLLVKNCSALANVTEVTRHTPTIKDGGSATALSLTLVNSGRTAYDGRTADCDAALVRDTIVFHKAVEENGTWVPGQAMTKAEVQQAVSSVALHVGGQLVGATGSSSVDSYGSLTIEHNAVLGNLVPLKPGVGVTASFKVTLSGNASQAPYQRFFIRRSNAGLSKLVALDGLTVPASSDLGSALAQTMIVIDPGYSPLEQWRVDHFGDPAGTGSAANNADYDGDGTPNLVEYATGTDPTVADAAANAANGLKLLPVQAGQPVKFILTLSDAAMADLNLRVRVEQSDSLKAWGTAAARQGGGAWTVLTPGFSIPQAGGVTVHHFTTAIEPHQIPTFFLRLVAEELP